MSALLVQVSLCANTLKAYRLALVVDVDGVGEEIRTLPINARSDQSSSCRLVGMTTSRAALSVAHGDAASAVTTGLTCFLLCCQQMCCS